MDTNRPYLIIPKLIEQPTWGGTYIAQMKGWGSFPALTNKKIGQSYELFSGTKLAVSIFDTSDPRFVPEIGTPDSAETNTADFKLTEGIDYINIPVTDPLLIKINHSKGNSFQLHIKPGLNDPKWQPKAESWYYLEDGKLTFGIKKGINIDDYKKTCIEINEFMQNLSGEIKSGAKSLDQARTEAHEFVLNKNPWQFVNFYEAKKHQIVDPSLGGIHHSWEEDSEKYPLGNVVFEIQQDVMDPVCTIRAFDQGKIKDDGTIRSLNIDDYFKHLDTSDLNNDIERSRVLSNYIYATNVLDVSENLNLSTENSYNHIYVRDGSIELTSVEAKLKVGRGHSAFVPKELKSYTIKPLEEGTVILKSYPTK